METNTTNDLNNLTSYEFRVVFVCTANGKRLEVSESDDHRLKVVLWELPLHANYRERVIARKVFRDCETQHHDSERWLNDQVGYPNDFAGLLSVRVWDK